MSIPGQFPRRLSRAVPVKAAPPDGIAAESVPGAPAAPGSWPWRRAALLASIAAQLITIAALEGADPVPATWTALLLAVAPAPLALIAAFAPAPAAWLAAAVLVTGMIGQITHTAVFFLPALAESGGLLMGRFLLTPGPGRPTIEQRVVAVALAGQAGAALAGAAWRSSGKQGRRPGPARG